MSPFGLLPIGASQHNQFQQCLLMTPQYPQFELWWSTLSSVSIIPASNVSNEEAFEGGMNENSVETKDIIAAKHGIEKTGVDIRTVYIENIEEAFEENEDRWMRMLRMLLNTALRRLGWRLCGC
jgi:hypothetical protein